MVGDILYISIYSIWVYISQITHTNHKYDYESFSKNCYDMAARNTRLKSACLTPCVRHLVCTVSPGSPPPVKCF